MMLRILSSEYRTRENLQQQESNLKRDVEYQAALRVRQR